MMRKTILAVTLLATAVPACAQMHTVSVGYQRDTASVSFFDSGDTAMTGLNIAYDFNPRPSGPGLTASMAYTAVSEEMSGYGQSAKVELEKFSLLAGPNWKFSQYVTVYGLVGFARGEARLTASGLFNGDASETTSGFAYGAGVKVNMTDAFSVRAGYEGTRLDDVSINGFNIGVGYSF